MYDLTWKAAYKTLVNNIFFWKVVFLAVLFSSMALIFWLIAIKKESASDGRKYSVDNLKEIDVEVLNYFVTYIVPLLSLDISSKTSILVNFLFIVLLGIYFVRNNALHFNIMLILLGYHIYTNDKDHIIISKRTLYEIKNNALKADQIGTSQIFYI